ncbi:hypothetical protein LCGC14_2553680 [marine sediment metagenome]|uniref:HK97 gp10 family phage protein n=1 Tax=marine sediment metagenome TaxID=412755 RepID=A0A0F9DFA7_9ZZZZ
MVKEITIKKREFYKKLNRFFFGVGNDLTTALIKNCPVDKAELKNGIGFRVIDKNKLEIFMPKHGFYVEFGTPPHIIKPKTKKALAFQSGGETIIVKEVKHPGTRAQPFIRNTFKAELPGIIIKNLMRVYGNS